MSKKQLKQLEKPTVSLSKTPCAASTNLKENITSIKSPQEDIFKCLKDLTEKVEHCQTSIAQLQKNAKTQEEVNKKILKRLDDIAVKLDTLASKKTNVHDSLVHDIDDLGDRIRGAFLL